MIQSFKKYINDIILNGFSFFGYFLLIIFSPIFYFHSIYFEKETKKNEEPKKNEETKKNEEPKYFICSYCSTKYKKFFVNCRNCGSNSIKEL